MVRDLGHERLLPVLARTRSIYHPVGPVAYDCVKLIFVRHGSAILLSEFGERPVTIGDVIMLGASTLCGSEPEGSITVTTLYLDRDYVIDKVFGTPARCEECRGREASEVRPLPQGERVLLVRLQTHDRTAP